jgi:hypothetical protein
MEAGPDTQIAQHNKALQLTARLQPSQNNLIPSALMLIAHRC